jgi:hypothetical protein
MKIVISDIKKYLKYVPYIIIAVLLLIIFLMTKCQGRIETKYIAEIEGYKDSVKTYKDKNGQLVSYNQVLEVNNKEQLLAIAQKDKQLADMIKNYKDIESATSVTTITQIVHDTIRFRDTIPADFTQIYINDTNKYYWLGAYIAPSFFMIDTLQFFNEQSIVVGSKKMGFLKSPEHRIEIKNSNPYVITKTISSYTIKDEKKWYESRLFIFGVGLAAGFVVYDQLRH